MNQLKIVKIKKCIFLLVAFTFFASTNSQEFSLENCLKEMEDAAREATNVSAKILANQTYQNALNAKEKSKAKCNKKTSDPKSNIGQAFKMSTELVSAVVVGTIIGFILDKWFGTKPWLILIFFFVGVIAGIMNVIKSAKKLQK